MTMLSPLSRSISRPARRSTVTRLLVCAALLTCGALLSCAHDSYLVVLMKSRSATITGVSKVIVNVKDAGGVHMVTRTFTPTNVTIDALTGETFSLSFSPDRSGQVTFDVSVTGTSGCFVGTGAATISKGGTANAATFLDPAVCPVVDAGAPDGKNTFAGCDPAVADSCGGGKTCYVDCANKVGACVAGGTKGPGVACASNSDCMPGTQCFDYGCATTTKICLKFCDNDSGCTAPTTIAAMATCRDPVACDPAPAPPTSYKTCGFLCDPRGTGATGCPTGLTCFLFKDPAGGEDSPACACPSTTRVGGDGATCVSSGDCAPGFLCDQMGGGQFCRKICKMSTPTDCTSPKTCTLLQNNTVFGVCI